MSHSNTRIKMLICLWDSCGFLLSFLVFLNHINHMVESISLILSILQVCEDVKRSNTVSSTVSRVYYYLIQRTWLPRVTANTHFIHILHTHYNRPQAPWLDVHRLQIELSTTHLNTTTTHAWRTRSVPTCSLQLGRPRIQTDRPLDWMWVCD